MELDEKGTQDFKNITGNPLYPYFAVVVAGKLLYVVQNLDQIKTGKAKILLEGYTKKEMEDMVNEVRKKR